MLEFSLAVLSTLSPYVNFLLLGVFFFIQMFVNAFLIVFRMVHYYCELKKGFIMLLPATSINAD